MTWAYLSETEGSFAIEGEAPTHDKATLFAALLRRAHEQRPLTEDLLVELQNAAISNPYDKAAQFRTEQNRLQKDVPGAAGVTYVPPAPELAVALMDGLMRLANHRPPTLDALVHAAMVSFAQLRVLQGDTQVLGKFPCRTSLAPVSKSANVRVHSPPAGAPFTPPFTPQR